MFTNKRIETPAGSKDVFAIKTWRVTWKSVHHTYPSLRHADIEEECEFFPSEELAKEFANSLQKALALIKAEGFTVTVRENK